METDARSELKNVAAERDILGDLLSRPNDLHEISSIIRTDDFFRQDYRLCYETLARMILAGKNPDLVMFVEALKENGDLEKAGGISAITDLFSVGRCYNLKEQAEIIARYARRRRLIDKARELEAAAADMSQDVEARTAEICDDLLMTSRPTEETVGDMRDACMEFLAMLERRKSGSLLKTGVHGLDSYLVGLEPGQLILIGARPGHGKTALSGTICMNLARDGKKALIFSLEMTRGELAGRFVARVGGIAGDKLKRANEMNDEDLDSVHNAVGVLEPLPIRTDDRGSLTPADIVATARRVQRTDGLDLVVVDHLGLMHSGRRQDTSRYAEISYISRQLKLLAKNLDVPVLALSQLSRDHDRAGRPPRLSDLRDSGSLEQDADTVILLHRPENPDADDVANPFVIGAPTTAYIAKQRNGRTGKCVLNFNTAFGYFEDAELEPMSKKQERRIQQILA